MWRVSAARSRSSRARRARFHEDLIRAQPAAERQAAPPSMRAGRADHPQAPVRRSELYAQAVRGLHHNDAPFDRETEEQVASTGRRGARDRRRRDRHRFRARPDLAAHRIGAARHRAVPGGQRADQCRQSGLQPDHQISGAPTTSASTRRKRGSPSTDKHSATSSRSSQQRCRPASIATDHHHARSTRLLRVRRATVRRCASRPSPSTVVDTVGAGDAFLAVTAPLVRGGRQHRGCRLHRQCGRRHQGRASSATAARSRRFRWSNSLPPC